MGLKKHIGVGRSWSIKVEFCPLDLAYSGSVLIVRLAETIHTRVWPAPIVRKQNVNALAWLAPIVLHE